MANSKKLIPVFRNPTCLEETEHVEALDELQVVEADRLQEKINQLSKEGAHRIIAYAGRFGSGKSVILDSLRTQDSQKKMPQYHWVAFDAWRYPDRQQLWDGLVVETIASIDNGSGPPNPHKVLDAIEEIEGRPKKDWPDTVFTWLSNNQTLGSIILFLIAIVVSWTLWHATIAYSLPGKDFIIAFIKYALPVSFLLLALMGIDSLKPQPGRPLRRVFELENRLLESLKSLESPLIIIAEDLDRAKEEGLVFIETLSSFFKRNKDDIGQSIIVLAPQEPTYFDALGSYDEFTRAVKVYDRVIYSGIPLLEDKELVALLKKLGIRRKFSDSLLSSVIAIVSEFRSQITMRLLKFILREVAEFTEAFPTANPSIAFILICSRYVSITRDKYSGQDERTLVIDRLSKSSDIYITGGNREQAASFVCALIALIGSAGSATRAHIKYYGQADEINLQYERNAIGNITKVIVALDNKYHILLNH